MKKIYYIKIACLSLVTWALTSCMDLDPKSQLGDNLLWNKAENFQLFANQFYSWTRDFQMSVDYGSGLSDGVHSDYRSDLIATSSVNTYSQGTNTIPATDKNYEELYRRIYYTNLLLDRAESFGDKGAIAIPIAEARFFRAYLHFELVQIWGDVALSTKVLDTDAPELYAPRNSRSEVIDHIIKDLQEASYVLPETATEEGRLTKYAALAMLSRVALYEGTWQKFHTGGSTTMTNTTRSTELLTIAKNAANDVIKDNKYKLFYNEILGDESYRYMFILEDAQCNPAGLTKKDNTEYILAHRHREGDKLAINITHAMQGNVVYITRKLANTYLCADGLPIGKSRFTIGYTGATDEFQNRDMRMSNTMLQNGQKYWNNDGKWRTKWNDEDKGLDNEGKSRYLTANVRSNSGYQNNKWAVERQVADYYESIDFPVIRYAEVLLNYAEAVYELNHSISNTDLDYSLNLVRQRVNKNMPKLSTDLVSANGLSMRDEIRRERTVELFLEGFRIDDLKRWATAATEMPQEQLGVKFTGTWFEANWAAQSRQLNNDGCIILYNDRVWESKHYLYPLPSDQRQLNPQLGQNPGWGN
ncbi:RagB/SusD family nutrient uptake outer membrane protein [Dysgonomonas sp. 511]|uniref:RagB/SusD family nutrient uptake outer membrane protein n=1 Tax=Dysgonomonas sp. 511 TaxID=2302930 RepID=UPI0013D42105|nr:RagB/SusD family nutrient uptake outer membrane protein [Dysgonomonas sp. 511]NDV79159.1 RagB/SusD family nutrient uptake outer membrane protein [Dysgonomonas sp. 511]